MSYQAIVYNVMIASPSDVLKERKIIRDVIHEWNSIHAQREKKVFIPTGWDTDVYPEQGDRPQTLINKQILKDADLLIAVFWTRLGTPTDKASSGTVEEINEHIKSGKPAMIYHSSKPVEPDSIDKTEYQRLKSFIKSLKTKGLVEGYNKLTDFRVKLNRHISQIINDKFNIDNAINDDIYNSVSLNQDTPINYLSSEARELLIETSKDKTGYIIKSETIGGLMIQTNNHQFVEGNNPRSEAIWLAALEELRNNNLVRDFGKGEIFQITKQGYDLADRILAI